MTERGYRAQAAFLLHVGNMAGSVSDVAYNHRTILNTTVEVIGVSLVPATRPNRLRHLIARQDDRDIITYNTKV